MILNSQFLDDILRLLGTNSKKLESISCSDLTLDALLELACCRWEWERTNNQEGLEFWMRIAEQNPILTQGWNTLQGQRSLHCYDDAPLNIVPNLELRSVRTRNDILNWELFSDRFARSLKKNGFGNLSLGLVGAFGEMADNIIQHSGTNSELPSSGIAAYAVEQNSMCYAVVDVGRGVLRSLRDNPQNAAIRDSQEALQAAIEGRASRRQRAIDDPPHGFSSLLESLGTVNADLRFRSGDGLLMHKGPALARQHSNMSVPNRDGLQLSVTCHLQAGAPQLIVGKFSK